MLTRRRILTFIYRLKPYLLFITPSAAFSAMSSPRRMLFLHGMFLPPECYTEKLAVDWFQALKKENYECDFVTSPRPCPDPTPGIVTAMFPDLRYFPEWVNAETKEDGSKTYHGLTDSLAFVQKYLKEQPRFDVIAGHSNGALLTSILALKMESDPDFIPPEKKCGAVVLFNAPGSYETEVQLKDIVGAHGSIRVPSVHVWGGPTDHTWQGQQRLLRVHHPTGKTIQHDAGHFFPDEAKYYDDILKALDEILSQKDEVELNQSG